MTFDTIIKNGTILDGTATEGKLADLGISDGRVAAIDDLKSARAELVIDAYGKYVAPGFVDAQNRSDSYFTLLETPSLESLVSQGITTIAVGHCGTSLAPLPGPDALKSIQKWRSIAGANINWLTFAEYYNVLQNYPLGTNVISLVGHSTIRRGLIGDQIRPATNEEIQIMDKLIRDAFNSGAAGLSFGLVYSHEAVSSADELLTAAKAVGEAKKLLSVHLRSEGGHIVEAVDEVLWLAKNAKVRLKISHFKARGKQNWAHLDAALARIDQAYQQGTDVFFDVYPYSTSWTVLYTYLPKWACEGGREKVLENLKNQSNRSKILAYLKDQEKNLGEIFIATSVTNPAVVGKTLSQVAANQEVSVEEALLNVLLAADGQAVVFDHNLFESQVETLLRHPLSVVATDGAGTNFVYQYSQGMVHPRCFGAFPKFLSMVREKKLMSWGDAIKKITSRPAEKLGLRDRGQIKKGWPADIVVFDPRDVGSKATYENPYRPADGIDYVFVNGKLSFAAKEEVREHAVKIIRL